MGSEYGHANWRQELLQWGEKRNSGECRSILVDPIVSTPPKLSDLLTFVRLARDTPEVWEAFSSLQAKITGGVINQKDIDEGNCPESRDAAAIFGQFAQWFRIKNNLENTSYFPYSNVQVILKEMARVNGGMSDKEIKEYLVKPFPVETDT